MTLIKITQADDPRLAVYRDIQERDLVGRQGRFIVEGKVTLGSLARQSRFEVESVFIGDSRVEPLEEILADLPQDVPVYVAPQSVMDEIAGFSIHRGVLACGLKGNPLNTHTLLAEHNLIVILAGLSNHDNVGAVFRNAAAFGAGAVLLDEGSCDPLYRKSIRVSAGAALWLPFVHGDLDEALLDHVLAAGFEVWAMTPRDNAAPLHSLKRPEKLAILLGAEGPGLSDALIDKSTPVRIPMVSGFDSVNVATAGAISLSHVFEGEGR